MPGFPWLIKLFFFSLYFSCMQTISSPQLTVTIAPKGAELKSISNRLTQLEYLWGADPAYWGKTSPVLFPIVGTLKNNRYHYKNKSYELTRHGFARDKEFAVEWQKEDSICFGLRQTEDTLLHYPFPFFFTITYTVKDDQLNVAYRVQNTGTGVLLFSVGGHPAFKVPLVSETSYEDYELYFEKEEAAPHWPISQEGLIRAEPLPLLENTHLLPLSKELFSKDALVFKNLQSTYVRLQSGKTKHGFEFSFEGFPYLGLWAATGADFLCIEPWCGLADSVDSLQQLEEKEGIQKVNAGESFAATWSIRCF